MENGAPIEGNLERVKYFFDKGIRYITLTHSKSNHISDSSYDENRQWGGLSTFGKKLISATSTQKIDGKLQPQALELEEAVLGALMIDLSLIHI